MGSWVFRFSVSDACDVWVGHGVFCVGVCEKTVGSVALCGILTPLYLGLTCI